MSVAFSHTKGYIAGATWTISADHTGNVGSATPTSSETTIYEVLGDGTVFHHGAVTSNQGVTVMEVR